MPMDSYAALFLLGAFFVVITAILMSVVVNAFKPRD